MTTDTPHTEVVQGMLQIHVSDVAALTRGYARLGLRVVTHTPDRALVELPCGVTLVLVRGGRSRSLRSLAA
jgi:hypothetical protein